MQDRVSIGPDDAILYLKMTLWEYSSLSLFCNKLGVSLGQFIYDTVFEKVWKEYDNVV